MEGKLFSWAFLSLKALLMTKIKEVYQACTAVPNVSYFDDNFVSLLCESRDKGGGDSWAAA